MKINNIEIEDSNTKLISYYISNSNIVPDYYDDKKSFPVYYDTDIGSQSLVVKLFIEADTKELLDKKISELLYKTSGVSNISFDSTYNYHCIYKTHKIENVKPDFCIIEFDFLAQKESMSYITRTLSYQQGRTSYPFLVTGTKKAEPIITIRLPISITSFTFDNITFTDISNENDSATYNTLIINCEDKTVKINGNNAFNQCNLIDFPIYEVGMNNITIPDVFTSGFMSYKEKYI